VSEEQLLSARDAASFELLYGRHVESLLGFFARRTRDSELAAGSQKDPTRGARVTVPRGARRVRSPWQREPPRESEPGGNVTIVEPVAPASGRRLDEAAAPLPVALVRRVPAEAGEIAGRRNAVLALAEERGISQGALADVALAVSEGCTNIVMHAYSTPRRRVP
jgi:hypothetical protein